MNQYVMNERAHWNEEVNGYFEQHVNAGTVGHYAIVTKNINGATRDTGFFSNECKTYDLKSGRKWHWQKCSWTDSIINHW